jgi:glutathione S-transferase
LEVLVAKIVVDLTIVNSFLLQIPFTNKAISFPVFLEMKPTLPCGQLPILELEDESGSVKVLSQSNAILRFVGKLNADVDLYPSDPVKAVETDMVIATVEDIAIFLTSSMGPKFLPIQETKWSDEQKVEMRTKLLESDVMNNVAYVSDAHPYLERSLRHFGCYSNSSRFFAGCSNST